jgi:hypothetical protein
MLPGERLTAGGEARSAGQAVVAWAVVVGADGRVVEPDGGAGERGGWAAPESASVVGVLADPPLRHDFGAMGVEIERPDVRLFLPGGESLPPNLDLVWSRDGRVRVVSENGGSWRGPDDVLCSSERAMAAAQESLPGNTSRGGPALCRCRRLLLRGRGRSGRRSRGGGPADVRCGPGSAMLTSAGGGPRLRRHTPQGTRKNIPPSLTCSRPRITRSHHGTATCGWSATQGCLRARRWIRSCRWGSARRRGPGRAG